MNGKKITKRTVDVLLSKDRDYIHWDGVLTGFGVRVRASGGKSFIAAYRLGGGIRRSVA